MAPTRIHRTISCAIVTEHTAKESSNSSIKAAIVAPKLPKSPPTVNRQGCATLFGRFSDATPSKCLLVTPNIEIKSRKISNLHPLEDPTLVGPNTLIPVIRRDCVSTEFSIDWNQEEIHPAYKSTTLSEPIVHTSKCLPLVEWPLSPRLSSPKTVTDRIAQFESMFKSTVMPQIKEADTEKEITGNQQLEKLLKAIGETPPTKTSRKLRRIAKEWWQTVHDNQVTQKDDDCHVDLSASLNFMGAALDPKCANLEVQALEELARLHAIPNRGRLSYK